MKIVDECKDGCRRGINLDRYFYPASSRQGETDYDQQCNKSTDSVDHFLHDIAFPISLSGAGLFHRTDTLGTMSV